MKKRVLFYLNGRAVIISGKKILMGYELKRYSHGGNHWETPGGGVNPRENIISSIKREAKEEIGVGVESINTRPFCFSFIGKDKTHCHVLYFVCKLHGKPSLKKARHKEFVDLKYIGKDEFFKLKKKNQIMYFDSKYMPKIMKQLKLW